MAFRIWYPPSNIDIRKIRERLGLSQELFCLKYGFEFHTFRNWEQRRRNPPASARTLLYLIANHQGCLDDCLFSYSEKSDLVADADFF